MCKWLGMLSLVCMMAACSNSDELEPEVVICPPGGWTGLLYQFDTKGFCPVDSVADVPDAVVDQLAGYGWIHENTFKINENGSCENKNYYEDFIGGGPKHFYFDTEGNLTAFLYVDAIPAVGYYTFGYRYDAAEHSIWAVGIGDTDYRVMQLLEVREYADLGEVYLTALVSLGVKGDGTPVYGLSYYHRATADELAKLRKDYPTDLSKIER